MARGAPGAAATLAAAEADWEQAKQDLERITREYEHEMNSLSIGKNERSLFEGMGKKKSK